MFSFPFQIQSVVESQTGHACGTNWSNVKRLSDRRDRSNQANAAGGGSHHPTAPMQRKEANSLFFFAIAAGFFPFVSMLFWMGRSSLK
jgi:hypothetical protein